jgi:2'-hydroxyisoflavone reductase
MKVLMLGGNRFVGRALVEAALDGGHQVVTLNRGKSAVPLAGTSNIQVDRTDHEALLSAVSATSWDLVVDTWSGAPVHGSFAAKILGPLTKHYAYVSSRSVYTWPIALRADESHPTVDADSHDAEDSNYAKAKRGNELGVLAARPDALIARAGLILGPHENVGRLPWWLLRMQRGGQVLAPGPQDRGLQYIDARDLAEWIVRFGEQGIGGVFDTVSAPAHSTMGELLRIACEVTNSSAELVWASPEAIEAAGIAPWTELPIWLPPSGEVAALHDSNTDKARAAGLRCRPMAETVADTWEWLRALAPDDRPNPPGIGLAPEKEAAVLSSLR